MRGKLEVKEFKSTATRIIPAHAGQTSPRWWAPSFRTDHPRACGANDDFLVQLGAMVGSSPRMRGKRCVGRVQHPWPRIIPAHAGQTRRDISTSGRSPDHPRACGANAWSPVYGRQDAGSSPRMRGKLHQVQRATHADRIIPAHAGQTRARSRRPYPPTDHPRACGANFSTTVLSCVLFGSSPRMRGKLGQIIKTETRNRIIPAHAGQTHGGVIVAVPSTDHPRACGANPNTVIPVTATAGSSPRMRGKHAVAGAARRVVRIIPAHAGQTSGLTYPMPSVADHPRACGANFRVREVVDAYAGSSPRMRGKRLHKRHRGKPVRIIPAHAGQT